MLKIKQLNIRIHNARTNKTLYDETFRYVNDDFMLQKLNSLATLYHHYIYELHCNIYHECGFGCGFVFCNDIHSRKDLNTFAHDA